MTETPTPEQTEEDLTAPVFGTWQRAYAFVIGLFLVEVVAFWILTSRAS
jgi:hypothetical protein